MKKRDRIMNWNGPHNSHHLTVATCISAAMLLVGCASDGTNGTAAQIGPVPTEWSTQTLSGETNDAWWLRFEDPRLTELIEVAQLQNTGIRQADARTRQALAQAGIALSDRLPQLGGVLNAANQKQSLAGFPIPGGGATSAETKTYGVSLNVSWEIDLWGRLAAQSRAARLDYLASEETFRLVRQSIAAQTAKAYFAVIEAREQVEFAESTVTALTETARQVGNRADIGVASPTDKFLSITNLETARAGLQQRRDAQQQSARQLETLLRDYPAGGILTPDALPRVPPHPPAGVPADLLLRRPDIQAAERSLHASGLRTAVARRAFLPAISLTGSTGGQSSELENLLDGDFSVWSIAGQVVQPIFQGGRLRANVDLARARQDEAAEAYVETALQALREVESSLASDAYLTERERSLLAGAEAAENAQTIAFNRYEQGLTPFITVLESQQRAIDTRSAWIAARRARLDNRVDLHLALGGSFSSPEELIQ